jgi:hypothetical protein
LFFLQPILVVQKKKKKGAEEREKGREKRKQLCKEPHPFVPQRGFNGGKNQIYHHPQNRD